MEAFLAAIPPAAAAVVSFAQSALRADDDENLSLLQDKMRGSRYYCLPRRSIEMRSDPFRKKRLLITKSAAAAAVS